MQVTMVVFIILSSSLLSSVQLKPIHRGVNFGAVEDGRTDESQGRFNSSSAPKDSVKDSKCAGPTAHAGVQLQIQEKHVVMDNGILQLTLSKPGGFITGIQYNGIDNLLDGRKGEFHRGYWDLVSEKRNGSNPDMMAGKIFKVMREDEEQVEVSFTRTWNPHRNAMAVPLNIDKRFAMRRGSSGFYTYGIYEHLQGWPQLRINESRIAFKLREDKFQYMAISDDRQRMMPFAEDRVPPRGQPLAYPEAVLLIDPINPDFKGEVDDKYQYSMNDEDNRVHGWISSDPPTGFWLITPSDEFRTGGPLRQDLTSHVGPTTLAMFISSHYGGVDLAPFISHGEAWKKVFGPYFIYVNSAPDEADPIVLWEDAKQQLQAEVESWPYNFLNSTDFPTCEQRGSVRGRLLVCDRYVDGHDVPANSAYVGLALPGDAGSWQRECKGYQFWTRADCNGNFRIINIRPGDYNLYATVPGFIGDYKYDQNITITEGCDIDLGEIVYEPPRDGPTLWEIGIPDRTAAEFYVPDPNPGYVNKLYINIERFRQYGLWERYTELYPNEDLVYTVGISDYSKDWFFAQVTRLTENYGYVGTTWQIKFEINSISQNGTYMLRIAIASAHLAHLQVRVNDITAESPIFASGLIGRDNSIARHGIHGLYWLFNISVPGSTLVEGDNTIFLSQIEGSNTFRGFLYDYIRLEGPSCDV